MNAADRHPANPNVFRDRQGVWDGDYLPLLSWEEPDARVVIPHDMQQAGALEARTYRWAQEKYRMIVSQRPELRHILLKIGDELMGWQWLGKETETGNIRILFHGSDGRSYSLTLGEDLNGSWNEISIVGSSSPAFARNRLRGVHDVVWRKADNRW